MSVSIAQAQNFFLILTRTLTVLAAVPVLGGRTIPARVRLGLGVLLSIALLPAAVQLPAPDSVEPLMSFLWNIARELVTGLLAAMAIRLAFGTIETAAKFMSDGVGFGAAAIFNPAFDTSGAAFDQFYMLAAMLIFLIIDGHHQLLRGLARTFDLVPLRGLTFTALEQDRLIRLSAGMLVSAVQIALPVLAAMILLDAALGLLSRAAPQMNVFFLGAPVKVGIGLLALAAAFPLLLTALTNLFGNTTTQMLQLLH